MIPIYMMIPTTRLMRDCKHGKRSDQCEVTQTKTNMKSSMEAEIVGGSGYIPWTLWLKRILSEQGYNITELVLSRQ